MRLLLTTTLLAGVFMPLSFAWSQGAVVDTMGILPIAPDGVSATNPSNGTETSTATTSSTSNNGTNRQTVLPQPRGHIQYPVGPVGPVGSRVSPVQPLQGASNGNDEDIDPYAAQGIRVGNYVLYPSISFIGEATDNIDGSSVPAQGRTGKTEIELRAESDWSRHKLTATTRAGMTGYNEPNRKPDTELFAEGELALDLADQSKLTLTGSAQKQREAANSVELTASGGSASVQSKLSAGAVLDQGAGVFRFQLRGSVASETYEEDKNRDFQTFILGGRVGFEITDQVTPFVDLELNRKVYKQSSNILNGDSLRGSIGLKVTNRETISGEASIGMMAWRPEVGGQKNDAILFADASMTWSPSALWSLTGGIETSLTSSSTTATSVATYTASLLANYAVRDNLDLGLSSTLSREVYNGSGRRDTVFDGSLSATYSLNRYSQLIGRVGHERRNSTQVGSGNSANKVELELKFQR